MAVGHISSVVRMKKKTMIKICESLLLWFVGSGLLMAAINAYRGKHKRSLLNNGLISAAIGLCITYILPHLLKRMFRERAPE